MGTSVLMIEKHYSHLKAIQAIEQLRGEETRRLIEAGGSPDHKKRVSRLRKRLHYLGTHSYSGMPGSAWRTE